MKIFTGQGIVKKLIFILILIIAFSSINPLNISFAADSDVGGVLLKPIVDLMVALGDFIMDLIHNVLYGMETSIIRIDTNIGILEILLIATAVIAAIALILAGGAALTVGALKILGAIAGRIGGVAIATELTAAAVGTLVATSIIGGTAAGMFVRSQFFSDEVVFPMYRVTPEEIFKGDIKLLNINFFKTKEELINDAEIDTTVNIQNSTEIAKAALNATILESNSADEIKKISDKLNKRLTDYHYKGDKITCKLGDTQEITRRWSKDTEAYEATIKARTGSNDGGKYTTYELKIFKGEWVNGEGTTLGLELKETVAKWYYAIRNFALVIMMVILLYIGIRMMISGVASEKAKYKNMIMDWIIAICLIFIMHYIMAFSMNIVDGIIEIFGTVNDDKNYAIIYEHTDKIENELKKADIDITSLITKDDEGNKIITWDAKNIVGMVRVQAALSNSGSYLYIGYVMSYVVLVFFTVFFLFTYLRRALYLTFFTIIAPLVAMTYPLDKLHDGKAQAFDMWIKEYIFNLMIQPVHLLLYTVLISSAFELASTNVLYMLVAIGFMMPAEKFLRKMFGFDKAQTPGLLSGAAGTALMVSGFNRLLNPKSSKSGKGKISESDESDDTKASKGPRFSKNMDDITTLMKEGKSTPNNNLLRQVNRGNNNKINRVNVPKLKSAKLNNGSGNRSVSIPKSTPRKKMNITGRTTPNKNLLRKVNRDNGNKPNKKMSLKERVKGSKVIRAAKGYANEFAGQQLKRTAKNIADAKPIAFLARTTKRLTFGAAGAMLGATFGLADDESSKKVPQYVSTLGVGGYTLGGRDFGPEYNEKQAYEEAKRARFENEQQYLEAELEEQRKKVIDNEKNQRELREYLRLQDLKEAKEKMNDYGDCIDSEITDMEDLATIIKLTEDGVMDKQMATTAAKQYKKIKEKPKNMGKKDRENIEFKYRNIAKSDLPKSKGETDEEYQKRLDQTVDIMLKNLDVYGSTKDKLTEL